jgi:hypothetical protein
MLGTRIMKIVQSAFLAVTLGFLSMSAQAVLINGSFESGVPFGPSGARIVSGGDVTGWTASGNGTVDYIEDGFFGLSAQHGSRFMDLTGGDQNDFGSMAQDINTILGRDYLLSFWIGGSDQFGEYGEIDGAPSIVVELSGVFNETFTGSRTSTTDWQMQTRMFTGTGGLAALTFTGDQPTNCCFIGLDNVKVTALSEPGTLSLLAFGLLGSGWVRRRKNA